MTRCTTHLRSSSGIIDISILQFQFKKRKCFKRQKFPVIWNFILVHINPRNRIPKHMYDWALWTAPLFKYGLNHVFPPSSTLPQSITDPSWHTLDHTNLVLYSTIHPVLPRTHYQILLNPKPNISKSWYRPRPEISNIVSFYCAGQAECDPSRHFSL